MDNTLLSIAFCGFSTNSGPFRATYIAHFVEFPQMARPFFVKTGLDKRAIIVYYPSLPSFQRKLFSHFPCTTARQHFRMFDRNDPLIRISVTNSTPKQPFHNAPSAKKQPAPLCWLQAAVAFCNFTVRAAPTFYAGYSGESPPSSGIFFRIRLRVRSFMPKRSGMVQGRLHVLGGDTGEDKNPVAFPISML